MADPQERQAKALESIDRHLKYLSKALEVLNQTFMEFGRAAKKSTQEADPNQIEGFSFEDLNRNKLAVHPQTLNEFYSLYEKTPEGSWKLKNEGN